MISTVRLRMRMLALAALAIAVAATAPFAAAQESGATPGSRLLDKGTFLISLRGKLLGRENFAIDVAGDSMVVRATSIVSHRIDGVDQQVKKLLNMTVSRDDYALRNYLSNERVGGHERIRGISLSSDTVFTIFKEVDGRGIGTAYPMPPGRVYVLESQLYTLMYYIALSLHSQPFDVRPINIVTLADRDTTAEAQVARLPSEPLRWGGKSVTASHLQFRQEPLVFDLWLDRQGRLLLMTHTGTGLRIEREAATTTPRPRTPAAAKSPSKPG
ncbi:MAG: hypothetical protein HOP12_03750 [Candidatus Eisenbacteria bacterium]|uniref:DUF3108 domain-containing protein n=1 Tax=Eiseniibacteriota bacterium TaxID=2212470 RepID=A0A849SN07_UNCEI|nr:hypothetical protein [Candidatus Eisenbacteria bacterium]